MESTFIDMEKGRTRGDGMEEEEETLPNKLENKNECVRKVSLVTTTITTKTSTRQQQARRKDSSSVQEKFYERQCSTGSISSGTSMPGLHSLYRRPETVTRSLKPVVPQGDLVQLKPRLVAPSIRLPEHKKTKPPKFVPFEPYPGAVNPIEPSMQPKMKINKNNLDIGVLVNQMSSIRTQELKDEQEKTKQKEISNTNESEENADTQAMLKLQEEIKKLKDERDYYQGQFKFQTQVNAELKSLLVASVGEDLQTHVNVLTEDKLQLARALLDTANNLSTHTEQIEFLAGQCEVWRSKFLASSVMIEELARWKADLTQKNQTLTESSKRLLEAIHQLRDMQLEVLKNLKFVAKIRYLNLPAADVISLSAENLNILQQMVLHAGVGMPEADLNISTTSKNTLCDAEKFALQALDFISQPLMATDEAIRALFEQAQRPYGYNMSPMTNSVEASISSMDQNKVNINNF